MNNPLNYKMMKLRNTLYPNQRIELYKILTHGSYADETLFIPGTIRPGYFPDNITWLQGTYIRILSNSKNLFRGMFILHKTKNPEVKPIGAFIVKKLKD